MEIAGQGQGLGYFATGMSDLRYHQPDWAAIHEEILCSLCQYNLRGLTEARCPECGYSFR